MQTPVTVAHRLVGCGSWALVCAGFSSCGMWAQYLWLTDLIAPWHLASSQIRDWTRVPCIGQWIPIHCTTSLCVCMWIIQLCPNLSDPMDCVATRLLCLWNSQARVLEWVVIPFSRGSSWLSDQTWVSCIDRQILYHLSHQGSPKVKVKVAQSCPTLCDPMDCTVNGILQARILDWVTCSFSRESSCPKTQTSVFYIAGGFFTKGTIRES